MKRQAPAGSPTGELFRNRLDNLTDEARQKRGVLHRIRRTLKHRDAIDPIIGRVRNDRLLHVNHLKGAEGDAINVVLCAAARVCGQPSDRRRGSELSPSPICGRARRN